MIETGTRWERDASIETVFLDEASICLLNPIGDLHDGHAGADEALRILACLSVDLGRTAQLLVVRLKELLFGAKLCTRDPMHVVVPVVLLDLSDREIAVRVLLRDGDRVVDSLLPLAVG